MTVINLLAPVAGLVKVRYRGEKADIDSQIFKLHYKTSATICLICCLLVTANDLIGSTIDCMSDGLPGNVMNTYCWIMSTFSMPSKNEKLNFWDVKFIGSFNFQAELRMSGKADILAGKQLKSRLGRRRFLAKNIGKKAFGSCIPG